MFGPPSSPSHGLPPSAWPQTPVASPLRFGTAQQPSYLFTFSPGAEAPPFVAVSPVPGPRPGSKSHGQLGSAATLNADEDMNGDVHYMDADVQGADPRKHFAASLDALGSHKRQRLDPYNSNVMHDRDAPMTLPLTESRASCVMTDADNANMGLPPLLAADSTMTCAESDAELEHASMKQFKATEELLITERTYVSDLEMLIDLVQEIMELKKLFANFLANYPDPRPLIKDLWRLHHSLLRDFQMSDGDPQKMCEAILNRLNEFSSYDAYIAILPPFRAAFDAALRDPKVEQQLAQKVRYAGDQAGLKPSEWLPKPFHRLTRLSMLCQKIANVCPSVAQGFEAARDALNSRLTLINASQMQPSRSYRFPKLVKTPTQAPSSPSRLEKVLNMFTSPGQKRQRDSVVLDDARSERMVVEPETERKKRRKIFGLFGKDM